MNDWFGWVRAGCKSDDSSKVGTSGVMSGAAQESTAAVRGIEDDHSSQSSILRPPFLLIAKVCPK